MDLMWLEDFQALARTGNFSRAARLRNVTQPAFSRRIRALEDWIGVTLFDRELQPVTLTPAGRRFEPAAQDLLQRLAQTAEDVRAAARAHGETLRFAATHALSFAFFPGWFHRFAEPATAVHLISDSLESCEERMSLGHVQFLLCHHHAAAPGPLTADRFRALTVGADRLCLVAAPSLLGRPSAPTHLPMLAYRPESGLGRIIDAAAPAPLRAMRPVFTSHLAAVLRSVALDGRGLAWLPLSLVEDDLAAGRLARATEESTDIAVEIRLFRQDAPQETVAEAFWSRLTQG